MENIIYSIRDSLEIPYYIDMVLFGSRSLGLDYPESDIDICVIHHDMDTLIPYIQKMQAIFSCTLKCNELDIVVFNITDANIDLGFTTTEKYNRDLNHIHRQMNILFPSELDRKLYIQKVRIARLNDDIDTYNKLKSWMKPNTATYM